MKIRCYVWTANGPRRLPLSTLQKRALPQYAGTRQKTVEARYEWRGPNLHLQLIGSYLAFDNKGGWDRGASAKGAIAFQHLGITKGKLGFVEVPNLQSVRAAKAETDKLRWQPSEDDKQLITHDLLPADDPRHRSIPIEKRNSKTAAKRSRSTRTAPRSRPQGSKGILK